eukprot:3940222-Rhodomonas_salina.1
MAARRRQVQLTWESCACVGAAERGSRRVSSEERERELAGARRQRLGHRGPRPQFCPRRHTVSEAAMP